jgi:hypothetical protein
MKKNTTPFRKTSICLSLILIVLHTSAQFSTSAEYPLIIDYSIFDYPFQQFGPQTISGALYTDNHDRTPDYRQIWKFQSPEQATQITNDLVASAHWGISKIKLFRSNDNLNFLSQALLTGAYDLFSTKLPYHANWLHDEGHRAVMASAFTYSYNPFGFKRHNDPSGDRFYPVNHVLDTNLSAMKSNNNSNFVRLSSIGGEMSIYASMKMQQNAFFNAPRDGAYTGARPLHSFYYLKSFLSVFNYLSTCSNKSKATEISLKQMEREGDHQELRDFTGLDYTAWAYDLINPKITYSERGNNPYGNGYDRYIYGDKLTSEAYAWIKKQSRFSLLNFFSPSLVFMDKIWINDDLQFNFSGRYYPTSFGNQVGIEFYIKTSNYKLFIAPHLNQNKNSSFMGIEAMIYEKPIKIARMRFLATGRVILDTQPKNQRFDEINTEFVGFAGGQIAFKIGKIFYPFVSVEGKTRGWVAGNAFLNQQASFKVGLSARIHYEYPGK